MTPGGNPYLDHYREQLVHQREHQGRMMLDHRPQEFCIRCVLESGQDAVPHGVKQRFAWAVPNEAALEAIARYSPNGVVEIGAGAGYWAGLLRARGVDVVAFDPAPAGGESDWHSGDAWSEVERGDHTVVAKYPDRSLLLVWPSYGGGWTDAVVDLYGGDTVVYVGEPAGGCTGTGRMHQLLGGGSVCWCFEDPCGCASAAEAQFREVEQVDIPQWGGIHDYLSVHRRLS